ncbi:Serine protease 56 [Hondaea fermentalgiana]|uniref:Serine protease 56 n=1 Tax=Hondaea fermentalgiana TaxID=2315210 RepID=A0A2R5G382_9STRA|nr:Serine protease 56 [Hondaea fermentalgiana]|eukprot:GBG25496.1 Serine protease 56 [Hondaea fermentalgiana]
MMSFTQWDARLLKTAFATIMVVFMVILGTADAATNMTIVPRTNSSVVKGASLINSRIVGGTTISPTVNPWMVSLIFEWTNGQSLCGGSYLGSTTSSHYFLTAGHCVPSPSEEDSLNTVYVFFLRDDLNEDDDDSFYMSQAYSASGDMITLHPSYTSNDYGLYNDIAIIKFAKTIPRTMPEPISLALDNSTLAVGTAVQVIGYGATYEDEENLDYELRSVYVNVVSTGSCQRVYGAVTEDMNICASASGKDSCQGDSGGPLFLTQGGEDVQVGVVSYGVGCARSGYPGVYTRVSSYKSWIDSVVGSGLVNYIAGNGTDGEYTMDDIAPSSAPSHLSGMGVLFTSFVALAAVYQTQ